MVRHIAGFVCALCAGLVVPAGADAQTVSGGIKGGVMAGRLSAEGTGAFETSAEVSVAGGGFLGVTLGSRLRLQVEALLTERQFSSTDATAPFEVRSRGLEVPLLLQVRGRSDRRVRPLVFGGPQLSLISSVTQSVGGHETDLGDQVADTDLAFTVGGGVEVAARHGAVVIDARAILGLSQLNERAPPDFSSRAFALFIGYRF